MELLALPMNATLNQTLAFCQPEEVPISISFGFILAVGIGCSYISQHAKILIKKDSFGLNWQMLLIANISNFCSLLNVLLLSDVFFCCDLVDSKQCFEKWIPILQIGMPAWNLIPIYIEFLVYHKEHEIEKKPIFNNRFFIWLQKNDYFASKLFFLLFMLIFVVGFSLTGALLTYLSPSPDAAFSFAYVCGGIGAVTNMLQWVPQIITTIRNGHVGSLSIIMLALQVPGGYAVVFFNAFIVKHPNITTWGPFALSATQQLLLLIVCIVFSIRDWRLNKKAKTEVLEEESDISAEEKALLLN
jgi:uncharacterized protein with PQ loop repeat